MHCWTSALQETSHRQCGKSRCRGFLFRRAASRGCPPHASMALRRRSPITAEVFRVSPLNNPSAPSFFISANRIEHIPVASVEEFKKVHPSLPVHHLRR